MTAQHPLFRPGPATGNLSKRQQLVLDLLRDHPEGLRSIDLGRHLHQIFTDNCYCGFTDPNTGRITACQYARGEGERVGKQLRARDLAIKRRTGRWQLLHPPTTPFDTFPPGF